MRKIRLTAAGLVSMLATAAAAAPTLYTGSQQIGSISAVYAIATNGKLGELTNEDIVWFKVKLSDSLSSVEYNQINGFASGSFTATNTALFSSGGFIDLNTNAIYDSRFTGGLNITYDNSSAQISDQAHNGPFSQGTEAPANRLAFAVVSNASVPEPTTWAMMSAGFGLLGAAARRRQSNLITYA